MKIAFVSEDPVCLQRVGDYLHRYYESLRLSAEIRLFSDAETLVKSMQESVYSLLLVDIRTLDGGISLIYQIRRFIPHVPVVLLRPQENGRVECIFIHPAMFLLNELSERSFTKMMDSVRGMLYSKPECTLLVNTVQNLDRIVPLTEIIYAEAMGHRVFLHLTSGELLEMPGPIRMLAEKLSGYAEFLFPHRSFIVNAFYVSCITPNALYLRTPPVTIPIARGKLENVKQAYDAYFRAFGRDTNVQPAAHTASGN